MLPSDERLPRAIYSVEQVRDLDRRAIEEHGVPGYELMRRAAAAALAALRARWPAARRIRVYCGAGNNGGDGYVLAALARAAGLEPTVVALVPLERLRGDAARAASECAAAGVAIAPFAAERVGSVGSVAGAGTDAAGAPDVVVDALLGTGLDRDATGDFAAAIAAINESHAPVVALDVPSGLSATTGWPLGCAVRAALTVTFVGLKKGLFLGVAEDYCGEIEFASLKLPAAVTAGIVPPLERLTLAELAAALPRRARSAHKGDNGRVLLIGGAPGTAGAIRLAAEAALRVGAGLVYVATHEASAAVVGGRPELMCRTVADARGLDALCALADAVVIGPGLGQDAWGEALWRHVLETDLPLVVDADGLNLLARQPAARGRWILTPHPGEAGRLLGSSAATVQQDRAGAARALAGRYGGVTVLKGARTLVAAGADAPLAVCDRGNPGMGSGGMGDVLSGVLGALIAQCGGDLERVARAGVLLHALAGDAAAAAGERGTIASDLFPHLRRWANPS